MAISMSDAVTTHSCLTMVARTKMADLVPSQMPRPWSHLGPDIQMIYHPRPLEEIGKSRKDETITTWMQSRAMPYDSGKDKKLTSLRE